MSIEQHLNALTEALNKNTEALLASGGKTVSTPEASTEVAEQKTKEVAEPKTKATKGKAAETKKGPVHTQAEATAALLKVKDDFGIEHAKELISALGFSKMSEITEDKYDEAFDLAEKKHAELSAETGDNDESGDDL